MKVDEICSRGVAHIPLTGSLHEAARLMRDRRASALLVTDGMPGRLRVRGLVTDRDIVVHGLADADAFGDKTVASVMTQGVLSIERDAYVGEALRTMLAHGVRNLAVVCEDRGLLGVLSIDEVICALVSDMALVAGIFQRARTGDARNVNQPRLYVS